MLFILWHAVCVIKGLMNNACYLLVNLPLTVLENLTMRIFLFVVAISLFTVTEDQAEAADFGFMLNFGNSGRSSSFWQHDHFQSRSHFSSQQQMRRSSVYSCWPGSSSSYYSNYRGSQRSYSQSRQRFRSYNNHSSNYRTFSNPRSFWFGF